MFVSWSGGGLHYGKLYINKLNKFPGIKAYTHSKICVLNCIRYGLFQTATTTETCTRDLNGDFIDVLYASAVLSWFSSNGLAYVVICDQNEIEIYIV